MIPGERHMAVPAVLIVSTAAACRGNGSIKNKD
jgi:hypothetical protein